MIFVITIIDFEEWNNLGLISEGLCLGYLISWLTDKYQYKKV